MGLPRRELNQLIRQRRRMGGDLYDEVWEGIYVMSPAADFEHQSLSGALVTALAMMLQSIDGVQVTPAINVTDRRDDWRKNFRVPDVAVILPGGEAEIIGPCVLGGPDFAVEILSRGDRSRKKFGFYHKVGVRELLLVNRKPWVLELYTRGNEAFRLVGTSTLDDPQSLVSAVLPVSFRLVSAEPRPQIQLATHDGTRHWSA